MAVMRRAAVLLLLACASAAPARAAFVRSVMDRVDAEPLFDSEYFLDLRGFSWPRAWDDAWAASSGGYRVNGASLDCCDLYTDQGLRLERRLTPALEFRFRFVELSDKDRQETHHWLELEHDVGGGLSTELFGEPTFRKEDADIGVGLRWRRAGWEARARRAAVDFNFNSRGSTTERYDRKPYTDELALSAPAGEGRAWAAAEFDQPTRRRVPDDGRVFGYRRSRAWTGWRGAGPLAPRVEYAYEHQRKSDSFAPGSAGTSSQAERKVHGVTASARLRRGGLEWEPGLAAFHRSTRVDYPLSPSAGERVKRWEAQPWLRARRDLGSGLTGELSSFLTLGENRSRLLAEAKVDAALEWSFGGRGAIAVHGSFDADTPSKPWDGGNVRAMFFF